MNDNELIYLVSELIKTRKGLLSLIAIVTLFIGLVGIAISTFNHFAKK